MVGVVVGVVFLALTVGSILLIQHSEEQSDVWLPVLPQAIAFALAGVYGARAPWLLPGAVLAPIALAAPLGTPAWGDEGPPVFLVEMYFVPGYAAITLLFLALGARFGSRRSTRR